MEDLDVSYSTQSNSSVEIIEVAFSSAEQSCILIVSLSTLGTES